MTKIGPPGSAGAGIDRVVVSTLLLSALSFGAPVFATTLTQSQVFHLSDGPRPDDSPFGAGGTLTFDKFDGSLGTLTDLTIDLSGLLQATGDATVVNTDPCSGGTGGAPDPGCSDSVSGSLSLTSLTGSLVFPASLMLPVISFSGTPSGGDSCTAVAPVTSCVLSITGSAPSSYHFSDYIGPGSTSMVDASFLVGPGTFDFLVGANALFASSASPGATVVPENGVLDWSGSAQVVYSYVPVQTHDPVTPPAPEPGTLVLLAVGVAGIGCTRRGRPKR